MRARFQRGGIKGVSPFFAFQDIITSAMAVLIAIIMLLAMYIGAPEPSVGGGPSSREMMIRLKGLLEEISRLRGEIDPAQEALAGGAVDPVLLKEQIAALREEWASLAAQSRAKGDQLEKIRAMDGAAKLRGELEAERKRIEAAKERLAQMEKEEARAREEMRRAEEDLKARESQLLATRAKRNQLWLIPDRSTSTKEPVLVTVSADRLTFQRFDRPEKQDIPTAATSREFAEALKRYPPLDHYLVFYFKPSGAPQFGPLTRAAKAAGFDIGYDVMDEEITLNFDTRK